jgi:hypothetical protein
LALDIVVVPTDIVLLDTVVFPTVRLALDIVVVPTDIVLLDTVVFPTVTLLLETVVLPTLIVLLVTTELPVVTLPDTVTTFPIFAVVCAILVQVLNMELYLYVYVPSLYIALLVGFIGNAIIYLTLKARW